MPLGEHSYVGLSPEGGDVAGNLPGKHKANFDVYGQCQCAKQGLLNIVEMETTCTASGSPSPSQDPGSDVFSTLWASRTMANDEQVGWDKAHLKTPRSCNPVLLVLDETKSHPKDATD